ncbi:MAG: DNA mismatch repair endonuclease MutL [Calditrichales bacterium]|nr:DNA mismatch repair endonuclease MutL [Calditrichales bacterium]
MEKSIIDNTIKILPENLANKIAAGEVVERPASVVKELVENAIDAEADKISVIIHQGCRKLIQVIDNGNGMSAEDLQLSFERHATSKIKSEDDLYSIETLGFRGEALPSIASVSQIEVKSRREMDKMGNIFSLNGGKEGRLKKTAANVGTSISVKNLFFNTPARRNFMRAESSENQQILVVLKRFFLAYPDIGFDLFIDDKQLFNLKESEIDERVRIIFGDLIFNGMIPLSVSLGGIELSGFISRPDTVRKSRVNQYLFLNGRPIQNKSLNHAIFQGYSKLISPGEYPIYCLFLEMSPSLVDVNIHPTKMEVRFTNDRSLYSFFINSVQKALNVEEATPQLSSAPSGSAVQKAIELENKPQEIVNELKNKKRSMARYSGSQLSLTYFEPQEKKSQTNGGQQNKLSYQDIPDVGNKEVNVSFWQIHNRYIVSEIKSGMVIIDQHVAHERVLYERITRILKKDGPSSGQKLLFPQKLTLNYEDFMTFEKIYRILNKIGFSIKIFSGNTIVIEAMPADVKVGRESQIILDIIDYYNNHPLHDFDHLEKIAAAYACKNAVKSGEALSQIEMHNLVDKLFACETPFFCPHGRPVFITIDLAELDRKFKRIP